MSRENEMPESQGGSSFLFRQLMAEAAVADVIGGKGGGANLDLMQRIIQDPCWKLKDSRITSWHILLVNVFDR